MVDQFRNNYDVCIVGAGVAGSTLAAYLGRGGLRVALIDKNWDEPDEIIGELLQPSGVEKLKEMGFNDVFDGIDAQQINGYAIYLKDEPHRLSYPTNEENRSYHGYGFRYGKFVQSLRKLTPGQDNVTRIEGTARQFLINTAGQIHGVKVDGTDHGHHEIQATLTVISQGSMSALRGDLTKASSDTKGYMLGVVLENCSLPFDHHGHVIMADPAPILAYPVGTNKIRVLIDFPRELPAMKGEQLTDYLTTTIQPQLPAGLRDSFAVAIKGMKPKGKPTHLLASRPILKSGAVLLGDALNMRHPTTGSGMTVALTDVKDLGDRLLALDSFDVMSIKSVVGEFYKRRHRENATVNILAYALYRVFRHATLRVACFEYLKRGGKFAAEPMSILSGISRSRSTLLKHFFAVAWLAVIQQLKPFPTYSRLAKSLSLVRDTLEIIVPLIKDEVPHVERG